MKVLVLTASTGNGHMSAARSVESELLARGHEAQTVDVLDHTGAGFRGWYRGGYEVLVKKRPRLWGHLYRTSDRRRFNYWFQTGLDLAFVARMRRFIVRERPDWVVCTHSLPQPVLARWRKRLGFRMAVVVTDLYPQLMWLRGRPDWFFVPGEWSREILERRSPAAVGRITVTGIPVAQKFAEHVSKDDARERLQLRVGVPLVLVTSGGIGGGPVAGVVEVLGRIPGIQTVVVCGRNEQAEKAAREQAKGDCRVTGHVDATEMANLMQAADLIVAKPGGLTTFEALAAGLPFVIYTPFLIPGQEEKNAEYLVDNGIGCSASDPPSLETALKNLLGDRGALRRMSDQALRHAKPNAAKDIADKLESLDCRV